MSWAEVDVFAEAGVPQDHLNRHPFGRIPAFEHGNFHLYETGAIVRYIDDAFPGCKLHPTEPKARAKVNQIVGIMDAYAYQTLVWDIYVERVVSAREGRLANEQKIAAALPRTAVCLSELTRLSDDRGYLIGDDTTLADLYAAPSFACFMQASEAMPLMKGCEKLAAWWQQVSARPSMSRTTP
ncbi:glutathione S-transferase [Paraburkholderia terricola]|jgi:glutathione S-transferase|uniref:glutathione S-transferase family protein n=1 Tax=Paraburkholderia terricola TaxID=169427 RepID=UPI002865E68C|nr:glutathione S-transferase family protein [Paraburkholderia terricola]MDR6495708.1 glutathione S-transferase [Paraburkholderia terricola]